MSVTTGMPRGFFHFLTEITTTELAHHISNFIFKVPSDSIRHIVSSLQCHVYWKSNPAIDVFKDAEFAEFR